MNLERKELDPTIRHLSSIYTEEKYTQKMANLEKKSKKKGYLIETKDGDVEWVGFWKFISKKIKGWFDINHTNDARRNLALLKFIELGNQFYNENNENNEKRTKFLKSIKTITCRRFNIKTSVFDQKEQTPSAKSLKKAVNET